MPNINFEDFVLGVAKVSDLSGLLSPGFGGFANQDAGGSGFSKTLARFAKMRSSSSSSSELSISSFSVSVSELPTRLGSGWSSSELSPSDCSTESDLRERTLGPFPPSGVGGWEETGQ